MTTSPQNGSATASSPVSAPASDTSSSQSGASNPERSGQSARFGPPELAPAAHDAPVSAVGVPFHEQAHKLTLIARQEADELRGWYSAVFVHRFRSPFDGELDAIKRRADQLGLKFKG